MNIKDFIKLVKRQLQNKEFDYILIDYAMRFLYYRKDEATELRIITNELMRLSQEHYMPVILLWQLNRELEKRSKIKYFIPHLSDMFGSSGADTDCRRAIMIGGERESDERHIFIRKASYSALYDFKIKIDQPSGRILHVIE
jgi:replicative DNA helicase